MTGSLLSRVLLTIELLATSTEGMALHEVAHGLDMPKSAAHRLLAELVERGYVHHDAVGIYRPTTKVLQLSHAWLAARSVPETLQPALDRLARSAGDLVGFAAVDGDRLAWIATAQGARFGLKVDPEPQMEVVLYCSPAGHAWLACHADDEAIRLVMSQGFGRLPDHGPNAPRTVDAFREQLTATRSRGYAWGNDSSAAGIACVAAAVHHPVNGRVLGVLSITGPSVRLNEARSAELSPTLLGTAADIGALSADAPMLRPDAQVLAPRSARVEAAADNARA